MAMITHGTQSGLNQGWTYRDRITVAQAGVSVVAYYADRYRHSSREEWAQRLAAGQLYRNGQALQRDAVLAPGDHLEYHRPPWVEPSVPLDFDVIYEDADLLVIVKPAGLPVLPGGPFLTHTLLHQLRHRYPDETPYPVHRLGRGTSGLMLLARSPLARSVLSQQLRQDTATAEDPQAPHHIVKTYRALAEPGDLPNRFTLTTPIGPVDHPWLGQVYAASPDGRFALSHGQVIQRSPTANLVEVTIRTGRPHQIRIHLAAAGYPLLGDPLYGVGGHPKIRSVPDQRIPVPGDLGYWLQAHHLTLAHPRTQAPMAFTCPLPMPEPEAVVVRPLP
ncbi:RNA pseudouridine synthase [Leptolyngbya sp. BL0902]|uniref:pseudouridine synthase n=1 Tax=Leptolyngbya sp. BL0902 TaxID=1115757 RepID=UPI001934D715|nr:pseudouridine synthase [Leptolyngbya sp. BL0902]QQE64429.1 RNA pseudouridine synthase [Leptolyngbya sp. BL0902]